MQSCQDAQSWWPVVAWVTSWPGLSSVYFSPPNCLQRSTVEGSVPELVSKVETVGCPRHQEGGRASEEQRQADVLVS